ncbi:MAG: ferritin family protein [Chloroflexota bacterium]
MSDTACDHREHGEKGSGTWRKAQRKEDYMREDLAELWDAAIYKEVASEAAYVAALDSTDDPAARELLRELAEQERTHSDWLKALRGSDWLDEEWDPREIRDLKISEYLSGGDRLQGASLSGVLTYAMKREEQAMQFYDRMAAVARNDQAKALSEKLREAERGHKAKLESFYEDVVYQDQG